MAPKDKTGRFWSAHAAPSGNSGGATLVKEIWVVKIFPTYKKAVVFGEITPCSSVWAGLSNALAHSPLPYTSTMCRWSRWSLLAWWGT